MNAAILGQVGLIVAIPIVVGAWLGLKVDETLGTTPWGLLGLIFVGLAIAGFGVTRLVQRHWDSNPVVPSSQRAREAGRRWEAEIRQREIEREKRQRERDEE